MKIKKLEEGMRGMFVDGTIVDISEPRTINTRNGPRSVADATLEDKTGRIKLSLWGDMIEKVKIGDEVTISGAYVKEFRGELQLNVSRSGTLETQDDRIATWIGHVKGWIAEDIENFREEASYRRKPRSEERTDALLYDGVTAKNLTVKELAEGRLPDDNLWQMNAEFVSKANQKYQARYFTRQARRAGWGEEDPFLVVSWIRRDSTDEEAAMDMEFYAAQRVEDFNHVREIFVRESNFVRQHFTPPDDTLS